MLLRSALLLALLLPRTAFAGTAVQGTLAPSCAPWDGAAFVVDLDNGIKANVWARIPGAGKNARFEIDGKPSENNGSLWRCETPEKCTEEKGTVTFSSIGRKTAGGTIDVHGPGGGRYAFKVKIADEKIVCR